MANLHVAGRCPAAPGRECLSIVVPLKRRAFLLTFYAAGNTLRVIDCGAPPTRHPHGEYAYEVQLPKDGTVTLLTFHALATFRGTVARRLAAHLRVAPGACQSALRPQDWLRDLRRIKVESADSAAHRAISLAWRDRRFAVKE